MQKEATTRASSGPAVPIDRGDVVMTRAETDHRAANSFQFAASMLRHESRAISDVEDARRALRNAGVRLAAMGTLHRQLSGTPSRAPVDLTEALTPICSEIERGLDVRTSIRAPGIVMPADDAVQIGTVLSELAMNAAKHGRRDGGPVTLSCEVVRPRRGGLRILARDDGAGLPEGFEMDRSTGLGMMIVAATVEQLAGTIRVLPGAGACFEIDLPSA